MIARRLAALVPLSRPRLFLLDLFIFGAPFALVGARRGRAPEMREIWLPALVFVVARVASMLLDAHKDAAADAAAGAPQFRSLTRLGRRMAAPLAYGGGALCLVLAALVNTVFLAVAISCALLTVLQYALRSVWPGSLAPFFVAPALVGAQSVLGWAAVETPGLVAALLFCGVFAWDVAHDCLGAIRDVDGDRAAGIMTPALRLGTRATWCLALAGVPVSYLALCAVAWGSGAAWFTLAGAPGVALCMWSIARGVRKGDRSAGSVRRGTEAYLAVSLVALVVCSCLARGPA